jgi:pyruvate/2-oxoglutarate dehydrogenase complex dihydrolipoamide dehydrogenase (E3) component
MSENLSIRDPDNHDRRLLRNVRPPGWRNPTPADRYNLVVIGAGTAGLVTAAGAAGLGARVALVEAGLFGGDCLNTGCVPSKAIIRSARVASDMKAAGEFGGTCSGFSFDFAKAMERMRGLRADISRHDSLERFSRELKVDVFIGHARFTGRDTIEVNGSRLRFRKAAVCTGTRPAIPSLPGLAAAGYLTNETVFQLTALPGRLAVIGGGPIGCELAQAFARMGSRVTIVQHGDQVLPREDREAAAIVQSSLEQDGVAVKLAAHAVAVTVSPGGKLIAIEAGGSRGELEADEILVAAGRVPNVEALDLEKAGVAFDPRQGVQVNDLLQTSNAHIYAAGDVCTSLRFTHAADAMARIVIANSLFPARQRMSALLIPSCMYTEPEVAHVGLHGAEALKAGDRVMTLTVPLSEVDRAVLEGDGTGFARVHLKKGTDRILGATIVSRHAGEMISEITLAMTSGLGLAAIGRTIHPYPTTGEAVRKLADLYARTRLTPLLKTILRRWLDWQR